MAKLIYVTPTSLDGYIGGGSFDWAIPGEEEFALIIDFMRPIGTYLYGRKIYETMAVWQTPEVFPSLKPADLEFARIWQAAAKIIYSKSMESASTPNTRIEREFDAQAVRDLKTQLPHDISIAGPTLAAHAIRAGLVDEYRLFVAPALLGGGIRVLPGDVRMNLDLVDERHTNSGWVFLRYRTRA